MNSIEFDKKQFFVKIPTVRKYFKNLRMELDFNFNLFVRKLTQKLKIDGKTTNDIEYN